MDISKSLIAVAVVATLPLAAFAGDKDKTMTPMATNAAAQFQKLDANADGRISHTEASRDSNIVFATTDKNGDGYLDTSEYMHRDVTHDSTMPRAEDPTMPSTGKPSDPTPPRQ